MTGGTAGPAELAEYLQLKKQTEEEARLMGEMKLLADPTTDFSALQDRVFGLLLRAVCAGVVVPELFTDELVLRVSTGRVRAPHLRARCVTVPPAGALLRPRAAGSVRTSGRAPPKKTGCCQGFALGADLTLTSDVPLVVAGLVDEPRG